MKNEIHIVLIWEKGLHKLDQILYDIKNSFDILEVKKVIWNNKFFSSNLTRFYGQNLPDGSFKEKHCGSGPFVSIVLRDNNPVYAKRQTSKGKALVNATVFDKKSMYREWTGGGHKIHTSNNLYESAHDILLLFNKRLKEYHNKPLWNNQTIEYNKNILGYNGWSDFNIFFEFVKKLNNYVILRNYNQIESIDPDESDIDFLTSDKNFHYDINAVKKHKNESRSAYTVNISGKEYNIDIRLLNDGYYDSKWSLDIVKNKILYNNKFFIPDSVNEFFSLLYHYLIHKNLASDKYSEKLMELSEKINIDFSIADYKDRERGLEILSNFLNKNEYAITNPNDYSVQYNYEKKGFKRYLWELIGKIKNG